jgi:hypothetical protein
MPILGMKFGNFKGEETALLAVLENGSISVNILKRQSLNDLHKVNINKDLFNFKRPAAYVECVKREKHHSKGTIYILLLKHSLTDHTFFYRNLPKVQA